MLDLGGWVCYATVMQFYIDGDNVHQQGGAHRHNRTIIEQAQQMRAAVGPQMDLASDLHGRYDATAGMKVAQAVEDLNLMWLEEPVPPENIDALARVTESTRTPICAGENAYLRYGFRDMLEKQAGDIIMPDISKCGGLSECRKIANMAETY